METMRTWIALLSILTGLFCQQVIASSNPRVFVFTDINIEAGDPDDRQSLIHLLWYADELNIVGIVPDRVTARGVEACNLVIDAYAEDYKQYGFSTAGYPPPEQLEEALVWDRAAVVERFRQQASDETDPLYVLVWGNMRQFSEVLRACIDLKSNLRVLTIGTGLMLDRDRRHVDPGKLQPPAVQLNWNGPGRNGIYTDPRFFDLWWIEINWTYNGMFSGTGPKEIFTKLLGYGQMGHHMEAVTRNNDWARYFRVGDTPSVLYLIDPSHDLDDPTQPSWAGTFRKPMPDKRPNYFTDDCGPVEWDYAHPERTWSNHEAFLDYCTSTLENRRPEMYRSLLQKLDNLYQTP